MHEDSWDTSRCSLPAKLAWNASRAAWSLAEASRDLREDAGSALGRGKGDDDSRGQVRTLPKACTSSEKRSQRCNGVSAVAAADLGPAISSDTSLWALKTALRYERNHGYWLLCRRPSMRTPQTQQNSSSRKTAQ